MLYSLTMPFFGGGDPASLLIQIIAILIALSVHEWAHAITATRLGDPTPHNEGRLTVNPIAHLDPLGALMFLFAGFGWAKPVPVNPSYFAHPKRDMAIVAIAGPVSNVILAILSVLLLCALQGGIPSGIDGLLSVATANPITLLIQKILIASLSINLSLAAFNLLPIAPLDGSKVLQLFIPWRYERQYEDFLRIGPFVLLFLVFFESFLPVQIVGGWVRFFVGLALTGIDLVLSLL
jgi:Zn-dependent protease